MEELKLWMRAAHNSVPSFTQARLFTRSAEILHNGISLQMLTDCDPVAVARAGMLSWQCCFNNNKINSPTSPVTEGDPEFWAS